MGKRRGGGALAKLRKTEPKKEKKKSGISLELFTGREEKDQQRQKKKKRKKKRHFQGTKKEKKKKVLFFEQLRDLQASLKKKKREKRDAHQAGFPHSCMGQRGGGKWRVGGVKKGELRKKKEDTSNQLQAYTLTLALREKGGKEKKKKPFKNSHIRDLRWGEEKRGGTSPFSSLFTSLHSFSR